MAKSAYDTDATPCAICDNPVDITDPGVGHVGDDHALASGYNLRLDDPDAEGLASHYVCPACAERLGGTGDVYVLMLPQVPDAPEDGDILKVKATVYGDVLTDVTYQVDDDHPGLDADSPEFELIRAFHLESDLPLDGFHQYEGVPDDAEEWEQIGSGWHSSMEPTDVSNRINALTRGDVGLYGPVLVHYGTSNNVCSQPVSIYAPEGSEVWSKDHHDRVTVKEYLEAGPRGGRAFGFST